MASPAANGVLHEQNTPVAIVALLIFSPLLEYLASKHYDESFSRNEVIQVLKAIVLVCLFVNSFDRLRRKRKDAIVSLMMATGCQILYLFSILIQMLFIRFEDDLLGPAAIFAVIYLCATAYVKGLENTKETESGQVHYYANNITTAPEELKEKTGETIC